MKSASSVMSTELGDGEHRAISFPSLLQFFAAFVDGTPMQAHIRFILARANQTARMSA